MQNGEGPGRQPALAWLVTVGAAAAVSWPFWAGPRYREPWFFFLYLFLVWALLIILLLVVGRTFSRSQEPPPPSSDQEAGSDV